MHSPVNLNVTREVKNVNRWSTNTCFLFIVPKACIKPATLFGWADDTRMADESAADSPEQYFISFEFKVLPSPRSTNAREPIGPTILPIQRRREGFVPFPSAKWNKNSFIQDFIQTFPSDDKLLFL